MITAAAERVQDVLRVQPVYKILAMNKPRTEEHEFPGQRQQEIRNFTEFMSEAYQKQKSENTEKKLPSAKYNRKGQEITCYITGKIDYKC